ncbi:MAG: sugar phosphate nucleotidyltransferase [Salinivirgaceae bacterium]|jgi:choline kinase|nr:sugar phosphate nucleotidyltransferase [Salinivirgaceae bacterium]
MKPTLVVLAAGMGSRYGGLKQLDKLGPSGETIMDYSVYDAIRAGFGKVVFVIRKSFEQDFSDIFVSKLEGKIDIELVFQELDNIPDGITLPEERTKPWGTGHAILVAKDAVKEPFAVINADDFYGAEAYQETADFLVNKSSEKEYAMCGYQLGKTLSDFGSVSRGVCKTDSQGYLVTVNERTSITEDDGVVTYKENEEAYELRKSDIVSMNFWGFHPSIFMHLEEKFTEFIKANLEDIKAEFYIPFVVDDLMKEGKIKAQVLKSEATWFGVTYQEDRPATVNKIKALVDNGKYPEKLW